MIKRVSFFFILALIMENLYAAGSVIFGLNSLPLAFIPIVVAFGAFFQLPFEAILTAFVVGITTDCIAGSALGLNVLAECLLWLICALCASWIGKPRWIILFAFTIFASVLYRIILYLLTWLFSSPSLNFGWLSLVLAPVFDGLVGYFLLRRIISVFTKSELGDLPQITPQHVKLR